MFLKKKGHVLVIRLVMSVEQDIEALSDEGVEEEEIQSEEGAATKQAEIEAGATQVWPPNLLNSAFSSGTISVLLGVEEK